MVDCGCGIEIEPLGPKVPTPGMVTVTPVPLLSVVDHDSVTLLLPPLKTDEGETLKKFIVGAGHGTTVTVTN